MKNFIRTKHLSFWFPRLKQYRLESYFYKDFVNSNQRQNVKYFSTMCMPSTYKNLKLNKISTKDSLIKNIYKKSEYNNRTSCFFSSGVERNSTPEEKTLRDVDKKIDKKTYFSEVNRIFALAKPEVKTLTSGILLLSLSSTITMAIPFALGHVIDIIYMTDSLVMKDNLNKVCGALMVVFLTGALSNFGRVYLLNTAGQRITKRLRLNVFSSIMRQETGFFDASRTGELVNRLSADTAIVSQAVTNNVSDGLRSCIMSVAGIGMMFYISPQLAIVGLSVVPPVALLAIFVGSFLKKISRQVQDTLAESTQVAEERIVNIRTVRSFAKEVEEISKYDQKVTQVLNLAYKEVFARGIFFALTGLSGNVIIILVLNYGSSLVTDAQLTVGQLTSFLLYAAYIGIAFNGLSSFYAEHKKGLGASTRLFELMERKPAIPISGGVMLPTLALEGHIRFENVKFAYPTRKDRLIFNDFSLTVPAGNVIALVGWSGSGKSTIGSLLLRLYDPQEGAVFVDNIDITHIDPTSLRSTIASVSQEPSLFSTSIYENIAYGYRGASPEETAAAVHRAAEEANALPFIEAFSEGFETLVGERGMTLSGGQKQRVAIARAIVANPRILLLDEATSALDAESERLVQEALERVMVGKTVITIAHRLSTIRNADQIAVLHKGKIAELGTYEELIAKGGLFRKLVERQTITNA